MNHPNKLSSCVEVNNSNCAYTGIEEIFSMRNELGFNVVEFEIENSTKISSIEYIWVGFRFDILELIQKPKQLSLSSHQMQTKHVAILHKTEILHPNYIFELRSYQFYLNPSQGVKFKVCMRWKIMRVKLCRCMFSLQMV